MNGTEEILVCSFCNKNQKEVKSIIAGPSVYICNECVELCTIIAQHEEDAEAAREIFINRNALLVGDHFVYTTGLHGDVYIDKDAVFAHPGDTERLCQMIARRFVDDDVEVVIGPAVGGAILAHYVAPCLSQMTKREVFAAFADKDTKNGGFVVKRGYDILLNRRKILVIDDTPNSGQTLAGVIKATRTVGGDVVGVGVLWNRSGTDLPGMLDVPKVEALVSERFETWTKEACAKTGPCARKIPINPDYGKGSEFLARQEG